jgi:hypothetical protein
MSIKKLSKEVRLFSGRELSATDQERESARSPNLIRSLGAMFRLLFEKRMTVLVG